MKELGAKMVISRAERDVQAKFLLRNGAEIYENIVLVYYPLFCRFEERMLCISENETR